MFVYPFVNVIKMWQIVGKRAWKAIWGSQNLAKLRHQPRANPPQNFRTNNPTFALVSLVYNVNIVNKSPSSAVTIKNK